MAFNLLVCPSVARLFLVMMHLQCYIHFLKLFCNARVDIVLSLVYVFGLLSFSSCSKVDSGMHLSHIRGLQPSGAFS